MIRLSLALLAVLVALPAVGDIRIVFDLAQPSLRGLYQPSPEKVETDVATELVRKLGPYFPHWVFVAGDLPCDSILRFRLDSRRRVVSLHAELWYRGAFIDRWDEVWLRPGEETAAGYPPAFSGAPTVLADAVMVELVPQHRVRMLEKMRQYIPLVTSGMWKRPLGAEEFRIVLPLRFQSEGPLNHSTFRLHCDWTDPGRGEAQVTGISFGARDQYRDPPRPPYDAIVLKPIYVTDQGVRKRISEVSLDQLKKPKRVYLESETAIAQPEAGSP